MRVRIGRIGSSSMIVMLRWLGMDELGLLLLRCVSRRWMRQLKHSGLQVLVMMLMLWNTRRCGRRFRTEGDLARCDRRRRFALLLLVQRSFLLSFQCCLIVRLCGTRCNCRARLKLLSLMFRCGCGGYIGQSIERTNSRGRWCTRFGSSSAASPPNNGRHRSFVDSLSFPECVCG